MSDNNTANTTANAALLFLAGAAMGALLVALTTPKTGPELRGDLKALGRRVKGKGEEMAGEAEEAWDEMKDEAGQALKDIKDKGARQASSTWNQIKEPAQKA